ncbi:TetR/AcrR family transcriptional regulator [Solicola sp. PLA-1-18]|uniref:TetR/AcrR family transcriptional regulator n=1 Tax=Solicola sp. PLA-1-18 TaxID=3380532 RepID=UPI003B7F02BF
MQVKDATPARRERRRQIVDALIDVVAVDGYDAATFGNLARRAGLSSTRLISYHFDDKDELVRAATSEIFGRIAAHLDAPAPAGPPTSALERYVRSAIGLNAELRREMRALAVLFLRHRPSSTPLYDRPQEHTAVGRVEQILQAGQEDGSMRPDFDTAVVAGAVQRAIDGIPLALALDPDIDLDHHADQLVDLFTRAVAAAT